MHQNSTRLIYYISRTLSGPLEALYTLLIFILSKDLNASLLQLTILASAKPLVSFLSFYGSSIAADKPQLHRQYLMGMSLTGALPCLFFPWIDNVWYYIASYALFMMTLRASFPVWNEILKKNLGLENIAKIVSNGTSVTFFIITFIPLILAFWMDQNSSLWRTFFFFLALLQLLSTFIICFLHIPCNSEIHSHKQVSLHDICIAPLQEGWSLVKQHSDFAKYLILFFLGGAGLVAIQPILPTFFKESLGLTYTQLTLAISFCKGISFISTSRLWAHFSSQISLYNLNFYINLFSCLFIAFILASQVDHNLLLVAYLMYGTMQAGCELSWNLSGPIYSKENESVKYSSLNLALVGIRGMICPFLGQFLFRNSSATFVFLCAGILCLAGMAYALWLDREQRSYAFN